MATNLPSDLDLLVRFACFGSEDGSCNVLANTDFSSTQTDAIQSVLMHDQGFEAVKRLKAVVQKKHYVSKDSLLYALAKIVRNMRSEELDHKEDKLRQEAYKLVQDLCETPMDLFTFVHFDKQVKPTNKAGWGRGMRNLVSHWYTSRTPIALAREATRCKSGKGWTHRDLLRQTHISPVGKSKAAAAVLSYLVKGKKELQTWMETDDAEAKDAVAVLKAVEQLNTSSESEKETVRSLIEVHSLTDRQIPSKFLRCKESFEGSIGHMPVTDVVKSFIKMAELGMLDPTSSHAEKICERLSDEEAVKKEQVPPVSIFVSLRKYDVNRSKRWVRNPKVVKSMQTAYDAALEVVPKIGGRNLIAVHVSSKMTRTHVSGTSVLKPVMPCAVMANMMAQTEDHYELVHFHSKVTNLKLNKSMRAVQIVEEIAQMTREQPSSVIDIAEPLKWAIQEKKAFDHIAIISDSKSCSSVQDLKDTISLYRTESGLPHAKIAIVGMSDFTSLGNRDDLNFLDVTGFNDTVPKLLHNFFKGISNDVE